MSKHGLTRKHAGRAVGSLRRNGADADGKFVCSPCMITILRCVDKIHYAVLSDPSASIKGCYMWRSLLILVYITTGYP
jgi:hypothetical protein